MKNPTCPKCGSKNTWRVTTTTVTTMTLGDDMTRSCQRDEQLLCDDCKYQWEHENEQEEVVE